VTSAGDDLNYMSYLRLEGLLSCQRPQARLEAGNGGGALATARRIAKILKTAVGQMDILETMRPRQFASFRAVLGSASGFQPYQFRYIEAAYGRRDFPSPMADANLDAITRRRPVFGSLLCFLRASGFSVPLDLLDRDPRLAWDADERLQTMLAEVYADSSTPEEVCEALIDLDEGIQEWWSRYLKVVERIIGLRPGTGGSVGAAYLCTTLSNPCFPDLWATRSRLSPALTRNVHDELALIVIMESS
jgi:tryptophan 2,3-dioxygenase